MVWYSLLDIQQTLSHRLPLPALPPPPVVYSPWDILLVLVWCDTPHWRYNKHGTLSHTPLSPHPLQYTHCGTFYWCRFGVILLTGGTTNMAHCLTHPSPPPPAVYSPWDILLVLVWCDTPHTTNMAHCLTHPSPPTPCSILTVGHSTGVGLVWYSSLEVQQTWHTVSHPASGQKVLLGSRSTSETISHKYC